MLTIVIGISVTFLGSLLVISTNLQLGYENMIVVACLVITIRLSLLFVAVIHEAVELVIVV